MVFVNDINWGPVDASEPDDDFIEKFVLTDEYNRLLDHGVPLISGEKGSGKTAICKYIAKELADQYSAIAKLSFNDLEFGLVVDNLRLISDLSGVSTLTMMSNYWQYVILMSVMSQYFKKNTGNFTPKETRIVEYLRKEKLLDKSILNTFLRLIQSSWRFLEITTDPSKIPDQIPTLNQDINDQVIENIRKFPVFQPEFIKIKEDFAAILNSKGHKCFAYLDEFDRLRVRKKTNSQSIQDIFEGLNDAVYSLHISEEFHKILTIKALIPHDRWVQIKPRDKDKSRLKHEAIKWKYPSFREFLRKRMASSSSFNEDVGFESAWAELFPKSIKNRCYSVNETVYEYLVRHTLYRPRQLQYHLLRIGNYFKNREVNSDEIPMIISESCEYLVEDFILEYKIDHPKLEWFLGRFRDMPNVMEFGEFQDITAAQLSKIGKSRDYTSFKIDQLYSMGFFGVIRYINEHDIDLKRRHEYISPKRHGKKTYVCQFYYKKHVSSITNRLHEDDLVCIHPMFFDFCSQSAHPDFLVG
jgi:hypothetical protein